VAPSAPKTKAAPPSAPKTKTAPPELPPVAEKKGGYFDDEYEPNKYVMAPTDDVLPRCPFCAKQLSSMDALICLNCGYNTRTRTRPEVKQVYQATFMEYFLWHLPAIISVLFMIGMLVWYLFFWNLIEDWLADSWFEDEPGPPRTYLGGLGPGFMRLYHALFIIFVSVPLVRFCLKRFIKQYKPPERKIKGED
jgi:hypothetical protein